MRLRHATQVLIASAVSVACQRDEGRVNSCRSGPIPDTPPDTIPTWVYADSNIVTNPPYMSGRMVKNVVAVMFKSSASASDRQAAVDFVCGELIGGSPSWTYFLRVPSDSLGAGMWRSVQALERHPSVEYAGPELIFTVDSLGDLN